MAGTRLGNGWLQNSSFRLYSGSWLQVNTGVAKKKLNGHRHPRPQRHGHCLGEGICSRWSWMQSESWHKWGGGQVTGRGHPLHLGSGQPPPERIFFWIFKQKMQGFMHFLLHLHIFSRPPPSGGEHVKCMGVENLAGVQPHRATNPPSPRQLAGWRKLVAQCTHQDAG